jgi:putative ABC transport system substrate-binding protein
VHGRTASAASEAYDPSATLAVHCGNGFDADFHPLSKDSLEALGCRLLSLGEDMQRREFIKLVGGAAAAWPLAAHAQQPATPVIGWISSRAASESSYLVAAFRQGLKETGYVEPQNTVLDFRWGNGHYELLPALASELVHRSVTVIVATGGDPAAQAAKAATVTIPIVFVSGSDPVKVGLVASLNRPGGNITGVHLLLLGMGAKRLGLLHELVPAANPIGVLANPNFADAHTQVRDVEDAARSLGLELLVLKASTELEIDAAFNQLVQRRIGAVLIGSDPFFTTRRGQLAALTLRHGIPAMFDLREYAAAGGLMSYGASLLDGYRQGGIYTGRILKGEKPADLPVMQSTKFDFVINLNIAKALGVAFPLGLLAIADEVIE